MAEVIDHFPGKPRRKQRTYPWDEWADGQNRILYRGFDFDIEADAFRNRMYDVAKKRGMEANTSKGILPREQWPDDVQEALSGPETEVLYVRFVDLVDAEPSSNGDSG